MDQVLEKLMETMISPEEEQYKTNYDGMYKNWGRLGQQEQRRKNILFVQKRDRNTNLDDCRGILDLVSAVEGPVAGPTADDPSTSDQASKRPAYRPSIYVSGFTKVCATYRDVLMMSEWLVEKPEDFDTNWYVVPCPKGVRALVVACRGSTKCYTKYGFHRLSCNTALPGGNPFDTNYKNHCIVLDCFHVEAKNTLFVLDVLAWNSQPMTDGETEFRHYWMKSHIEDIPELKTISEKNKILFEILPKVDCDRASLNNKFWSKVGPFYLEYRDRIMFAYEQNTESSFMMKYPHFENFVPDLDGLLFYHKNAHYISGVTPLVGWLYPFMVQEVLGHDIEVNPAYMLAKPAEYINQAQFIHHFETKIQKKTDVIPGLPPPPLCTNPVCAKAQALKLERQREQSMREQGLVEQCTKTDDSKMDTENIPPVRAEGRRGRRRRSGASRRAAAAAAAAAAASASASASTSASTSASASASTSASAGASASSPTDSHGSEDMEMETVKTPEDPSE